MAYAQDTLTSANAANGLANVFTGLLIAEGWTLVETLTPAGTNTPTTKVYKSDGTLNACGYDWYVAIMYKATGTEAQVQIIAGGAYNTGTKTISQIAANRTPPNGSGGLQYAEPVTGDQWGGYNVNQATNTTTTVTSPHSLANSQTKPWFAVIVPSSAFAYWMSVTLDHVYVGTTIPGFYLASTLDVAPDWIALNTASTPPFANGVAVNPVVSFATLDGGLNNGGGISATVIGTPGAASNVNKIVPTSRWASVVGTPLPIISGSYLPAYAWRPAWYLAGVDGVGGTPTYDAPRFGDGFHIGDGIDYYMVYGGSIGDTVVILGATYVLSGLILGTAGTTSAAYIAVLVE